MIKPFTLILGIVLLAVGVIGIMTGGHNHELIVFGINMTHNVVHVLSGVLALVAGLAGVRHAKLYCLIFGAVYGIVTVAGFVNLAPVVSMLNLNMPDNLLHLGIAASCLYVGATTKAATA